MNLIAAVWAPLVVCGNSEAPFNHPCGYADLIVLARNLITDLTILSTFLATMAFIYVGFMLVTSGGNSSKKDEAKKIALKVLIGYMWIIFAWVLAYTITNTLLKSGYSILGGT